MKKLLLLLAVMLVSIAAQAWTVKFTNPDNWAKVYVWAWNGGTNYTGGSWPGKEMTKSGDVWVYEAEGNPALIIFNNGEGTQTGSLPFVDNSTYDKNGPVGVVIKPEVYLTGTINDWATDNADYKFSTTDDVNFTFHMDALPAETMVKIFNGKDYLSYDGTPESGVEYTLTDTGMEGQIYFPTAVTDITFKFNVETNAAIITYNKGDEPVITVKVPDALYVVGDLSNGQWNPTAAGTVALTKNGNEFTGEFTLIDADENCSYFSFLTALDDETSAKPWDGANSGDRYGAAVANEPAIIGNVTPVTLYAEGVNASSAASWKVAPGKYGVKVIFGENAIEMVLTQISSGVAGVEVADEAPVYFNLQGVRVAEPQNGVYVVRRGAKVSKEMIRK